MLANGDTMSRNLYYLSHKITGTEMCPECHHMTIHNIKATIMSDTGVNGNCQIKTRCEECHPNDEEGDE